METRQKVFGTERSARAVQAAGGRVRRRPSASLLALVSIAAAVLLAGCAGPDLRVASAAAGPRPATELAASPSRGPDAMGLLQPPSVVASEPTSGEGTATAVAARQGPPQIPHSPEGRSDCLACHGQAMLWPVPASHEGRPSETCRSCHTPLPGGPPEIAHPIEGRAACTTCHAADSIAPLPVTHTEHTERVCVLCHTEVGQPPKIGHTLEGKSACASCHGQGGLAGLSASHQGRSEATCQVCHTQTAQPPLAPHPVKDRPACSGCHSSNKLEALPESHSGRTDGTCVICHEPAPGGVPKIPHGVEGRSECVLCHEAVRW